MAAVEVVEEARPAPQTAGQAEPFAEKLDLEDRVFVTLNAGHTSAYVNELIPVTVKLYVNRLNVSDIQLPTFAQEGFSKVEFREPKQYRENLNGLVYDVLEFKTNIFGTRPGEYRLGPAAIKCNIMVRRNVARMPRTQNEFFEDEFFKDSFFQNAMARYERHPMELKSQDAPVIISPLPEEGKPADFSGAIGDYQFIYNAGPKKVRTGDPITLTMEINGAGNFNTVLIPKLDNVEGFKIYEPQIHTEENRKTFKQVLIPETDQVTQAPKAIFNYFDPESRQYKTVSHAPIPIQVEKGKYEGPAQVVGPQVTAPGPAPEEERRRNMIYIKESPDKWQKAGYGIYKSKIFLIFVMLPLLFLIIFYAIARRRNKFKRDTVYAGRVRALGLSKTGVKALKSLMKAKNAKGFYELLFKTMQDYLGNRLHVPPAGITADIGDSLLAQKEVDLDIVRKVKALFDACDRARFALSDIDEMKVYDDLKEMEEVMRYFERVKL